MPRGLIRPIVKDLAASKSDSANYRPVLNSSNLFKVFEYFSLSTLTKHLKLSYEQFAFRDDTDCVAAVLVMKEAIAKYVQSCNEVRPFGYLNYCIFKSTRQN